MKKDFFTIHENDGTSFSGECHPEMTVQQVVQNFLELPLAEGRFHDGGAYNSDTIYEYNESGDNDGLDYEYSVSVSYAVPTSSWRVSI